MEEMIKAKKVLDTNGEAVTMDTSEVKEFFQSEPVLNTRSNEDLQNYLYDQVEEVQSSTPKAHVAIKENASDAAKSNGVKKEEGKKMTWTKYCEEPDRKIFYKQENGMPFATTLSDCVVEAGLMETIACYENVEVLEDLMPEFYDVKWL